MRYKKIGNSDLSLSVVTFGAWAAGGWMWGGSDEMQAIKAIQSSIDHGVTSIDTAPIYGQGASELIVGKAIKGIPRHQLQIATKFGMRWDTKKGDFTFKSRDNHGKEIDIYKYAGRESVIKECEDSLKRLGTDYIDLYQLHWPDKTTPIEETMEAMNLLMQQGKIRYAGVCNYDVDQMKEANRYINLVSDQVSYSMVKRDIEKNLIPFCIESNTSILAYSPLERGLLTGKMYSGYEFKEGDHRRGIHFFKDENIKRTNAFLEKIKPVATAKQMTLTQLVILWTLKQSGITVCLVGARNPEQAIENAKALDFKLSDEEVAYISTELDNLRLITDKN